MQEIRGVAAWLAEREPHLVDRVDTLPSPTFMAGGRKYTSFSTNNYLGLASSQRLIAAARAGLERYGVGNCESRLLGGDLEIYDALERKLAQQKKAESAILFATGYLANLGVLSSLPRIGQYARIYGFKSRGVQSYCYFGDEYNHLSIREGIRMSGADRKTFRHGDLNHLETLLRASTADNRIIVTDGVFSQDGDIADLPGMLELAERYDAMVYVDDAHGTGVLGENGNGICEHFGIASPRLIHMGTLSKAYGAIGGFIATETAITSVLRLTCSAYGFTSTLPPDQAMAVSEALDIVKDEPERRERLWDNQRYFVSRMRELPYQLVSTQTPIVPILIGGERDADEMAARLHAEGINVDAVKFPAVPLKKARLRIQLNAGHTHAQIDRLVDVLANVGKPTVVPLRIASSASRRTTETRPWRIAAFAPLGVAARQMLATASTAARRAVQHAKTMWSDIGIALNVVMAATALVIAVDVTWDVPHLIYAYLLPIFFVARRFGRTSALIASLVAVACAAFLMYEPVLSLYVEDGNDVRELIVFSILATLVSHMTNMRTPAKALAS